VLHKLAGRVRAEAWEAVDLRGVQCRHIRHPHLVQESLVSTLDSAVRTPDTNLPTEMDHDVVRPQFCTYKNPRAFRKI
jgi:hypothetical protein